jgi:hypothetical protein
VPRVEPQDGKLLACNSGEQPTGKNENAAKNECRGGASFSIGTVSAGTEVDERMMSTDQLMKLEEEP